MLSLSTGLVQPLQLAGGPNQVAPPSAANSQSKHQASLAARFQAQPLQPLQKRDSFYSKVPTCYESTLTLFEPELNDQRDYQLMVVNDQGQAFGSVRLRVASPLSPVLMISSAFVTIFGLFVCSLMFMFVFKRRQQLFASGRAAIQRNGAANGQAAQANGSAQTATNGSQNGSLKGAAAAEEANGLQKSRTTNGFANGNLNHHHHHHHLASQTKGVVNGTGNGLANGASNPTSGALNAAGSAELCGEEPMVLAAGKLGGGHLLSMASSDTSCNDQKQLLPSSANNLDRATGGEANLLGSRNEAFSGLGHSQQQLSASDRSSANSSPTIPMNYISVDDELQLNGTYRAAESVTHGAQLSPMGANAPPTPSGNGALIYANIDYGGHQFGLAQPQRSGYPSHQRASLQRKQTPVGELDSPTGSLDTVQEQLNYQRIQATSPPAHQQQQQRSSVGATIAMMNSLAAAAAAAANSAQQPSPGQGALSGAINQQLNARGQPRKPGPPKPPKPSIQQRSRFYQQQQGLVMIGDSPGAAELASEAERAKQQDQSELALEYSRIAFPARAEL